MAKHNAQSNNPSSPILHKNLLVNSSRGNIFITTTHCEKKITNISLLVPQTTKNMASGMKVARTSLKYLTQDEAITLDQKLFNDYAFSVDQLMELAGLSVAIAIAKSYPLIERKHDKPVICCGPGNNGGDGLVCARHLKLFGYSPVVICPKPGRGQLFQNLLTQCKGFEIDILDQVPNDKNISFLGNLIVDSIFGFSFKPPNKNAHFASLLKSMHKSNTIEKLPLISVDIPSGWHVENGYRDIESDQKDVEDNLKLPVLQPNCLVSLTAPKLCANFFSGQFHYLGGRFCPKSLQEEYSLNLPKYPGTEGVVLL